MDWVDASKVRPILARLYWSDSPAKLTREEFGLIYEAHPDKFKHPVHPLLRKVGVLGTLFGKLIFEDRNG